MSISPLICLVNPWITDFAAHDLWSKPLGLLYVGTLLKKAGYSISLIDCQSYSFASPKYPFPRRTSMGTGHLRKEPIPKPEIIKDFPRIFYRYGISIQDFEQELIKLKNTNPPGLFLLSTQMTYWYQGVQTTINKIREFFTDTPIMLGGLYPTLCNQHAQLNFSDCILHSGQFDQGILDTIHAITSHSSSYRIPPSLLDYPTPDFTLYPKLDSIAFLTSIGCPYNCNICASKILFPSFKQKAVDKLLSELNEYNYKLGIKNYAFYDDALLTSADKHIIPFLEKVIDSGLKVNFHVPNGLMINDINSRVAGLLFRAGFREIRLSFEGYGTEGSFIKPLSEKIFSTAVNALNKAGFTHNDLRAYLIVGIPGQNIEELVNSAMLTHRLGVRTELTYYSLIPGTPGFENYKKNTKFAIDLEPLLHNNTLWNWRLKEPFKWEKALRALVRFLNSNLKEGIIINSKNNEVRDLIEACIKP